jgi:hypothetical protein
LTKPVLAQPASQILLPEASHYSFAIVLFANHDGFRTLGHGVHQNVGVGGND